MPWTVCKKEPHMPCAFALSPILRLSVSLKKFVHLCDIFLYVVSFCLLRLMHKILIHAYVLQVDINQRDKDGFTFCFFAAFLGTCGAHSRARTFRTPTSSPPPASQERLTEIDRQSDIYIYIYIERERDGKIHRGRGGYEMSRNRIETASHLTTTHRPEPDSPFARRAQGRPQHKRPQWSDSDFWCCARRQARLPPYIVAAERQPSTGLAQRPVPTTYCRPT